MSITPKIEMQPVVVKNALLVDADPQLQTLLLGILGPWSWSIRHAKDNTAALGMVQSRTFDLIITSARTSGKEDIELLRKIRNVRPHTCLIILADQSTPADVIESMRERAFSYFTTPFSRETLTYMIRMAMEGPRWDDGIEVVSATPEWIQIMVRSDVKTADRLVQFLNEVAELPDAEKHQVAMAFREMLLNAIEHGARFDPNRYVEIEYVRARHMISCRIKDPGTGFTLDEIPHAAIANPDDDPTRHLGLREEQGMRPGGYGVLITQHLVDQLIYGQDGNEVLLIKYLDLGLQKSA
jgi:DNA-binding response OmpR family regulator